MKPLVIFTLLFCCHRSYCQEPTAFVLLVGMNSLDHSKYGSRYSEAPLSGAEMDIGNMKYMLRKSGYTKNQISVLWNEEATRKRILDSLSSITKRAAKNKANNLIIFYFTGHGDQTLDLNNDEEDGQDEILICYDQKLIDDDLNKIWVNISPSIRILMIVDACHSGTTYKMLDHKVNFVEKMRSLKFRNELSFNKSMVRPEENRSIYSNADEPYQMIYLSAARDPTTAAGGLSSAFTTKLRSIFNHYETRPVEWKKLTYKEYLSKTAASLIDQKITYAEVGKCKEILKDYPFKIKDP